MVCCTFPEHPRRSHHLSSLKFLRNLRKIHGRPLENEHYALVLYNNRRVQELWKIEGHLEFEHGGMYIHLNNRLCNRYLKQFIANVVHDRSLNSLQSSEEEVLCDPSKLSLQLKVNFPNFIISNNKEDDNYSARSFHTIQSNFFGQSFKPRIMLL